ncbi:hypothetical protein WA026_009502 [Henosepilachna vigintioctopunctata]|uniref:Uncharacterized protein n=1 Tax=Henosepilachna vigintioctopunctata TaxID=420089 RepID=A0AAW1U6F1_9CUCU
MSSSGGGCSPECPSVKKESPARSRTRTTTRTNVASVSRSPLYVDDATLNAMMANLETFGHGLGQFSPQRTAGTGRVPYPPYPSPHVTPELQPDSFAAPMDYNLSWNAKDVELTDMVDRTPPRVHDETADQFLLTESELSPDIGDERVSEKRRQSIIEWFDRSVEKELDKRKDKDFKASKCAEKADAARADLSKSPTKSPPGMKDLAQATASGIEIIGGLLHERDADLIEAVEKLATAEAMCNFAGAVEAAEEAAKSVPLECAEEAAAAGARGYQKEITNIVNQTIPGQHPIEVLGYVGVTKPKYPRKPNQ